ncbi:MAG: TRAP transporter permease [Candidatus Aminicenantes bacterium]|nr:TRAP transporter permease [Candidatus Aminicenantes bacterium]
MKLKTVISAIAVIWALFQLSLPSFLILDSIKTRAIHLSFALLLAFLILPFRKTGKQKLEAAGEKERVSLPDFLLAAAGALAALYIMLDWEGIALRSGTPLLRDIVIGLLLVVLLLEAGRRAIGPALSIIVTGFTLYAFLGPYMIDILAFKGVSIRKYVTQVSLSSEGIYGIPLGVSAVVVYLFVLLGALLEKAGAGKFFIDLALALLGRFRGGPAKAAVGASGLMGMISGSSIANIVTTGTFTIPLMKRVGYPAKKAAAIEVAASTDGQLMPPIMGAAAFIIAEYVNVPYVEVIKAAAIPAFVSYFALFYITHLEAKKLGIEGLPKHELPGFFITLKKGIPFLLPIGILLFELLVMRRSPELAAFKAIILLVIVIICREIAAAFRAGKSLKSALKKILRTLIEGMVNGSKNMIPVALATAAAGIIVGIVSMGIGGMITQIVEAISGGNIFVLLIITALASLLLGMGLPTTATYIVMASLTAPIIVQVSTIYGFFVPLMAAHLFCFYFGILADDTPPVGLAAYAAAAIAKSEPIPTGIQGFFYDLRTAVIPFMFIFNTDLILYRIESWPLGILIFVMAVLGAFSFTSVLQGFFITKNKWYEVPFFLMATLILFNPAVISNLLNVPPRNKYFFYIAGVVIFWGIAILQKSRKKKE